MTDQHTTQDAWNRDFTPFHSQMNGTPPTPAGPVGSSIPVLITGLGPISSLGCGIAPFWHSIRTGRVGTRTLEPSRLEALKAGIPEMDLGCTVGSYLTDAEFRLADYLAMTNASPVYAEMLASAPSRAIQFAIAAAVLAIRDAGLEELLTDQASVKSQLDRSRIGVVVGTIGNLDTIEGLVLNLSRSGASAFLGHSGATAAILTGLLNLTGPAETVCGGCPAGMDAAGYGWRLIQLGVVDACLVVGSDSELHAATYSSFVHSRSLATKFNDRPDEASRPFDARRDGNIVGEGAGSLMLESERFVRMREEAGTHRQTYARLSGYVKASCGSRRFGRGGAIVPDVKCSKAAIERCLTLCQWRPSDVSAFHANGSASKLYDAVEAESIHAIFACDRPEFPVFSIKGAIGQHGAGCTALQLIATASALYHAVLPGTANFVDSDPRLAPIHVTRESRSGTELEKVMCQAISLAGFHWSILAMEKHIPQSKL